MADPKVLQVQQWLLDTYGNRTEFSEFVSRSGFTANGNTGNNTMTLLIFALQYELGISGPTGNFGPTTINLSPAIQLSNAHTFSENIIKILEGGLWCHGYSAGYSESDDRFGGTYDADTDKAVKQLQADIGIGESGRFDGYLWKALLSTDPFVTTWTNGSSELREAQQYLNSLAINGYYFADDYLGQYIPTDGLNSRTFSNALILYIQAIQGISAPQATGNLGPATQSGLVNIPDSLPENTEKSRHFVRAVVFALLANGYEVNINSYWSTETSDVIKEFQSDMAIPVIGKVNFTTWMALLISYGDKNRAYSACDTRFEITASRLNKLKSMGITAVGRYINGTDFKVLRADEPARIIDGGLKLIPIYQENGTSSSDFSFEEGVRQAQNARLKLKEFRIPRESTVFFAVDYDAQDWEITNYILPYFRGITSSIGNYNVGVYGTRNLCTKVVGSGLAVTSYVSNMSSGYSGNLGFKMPSNWAFDQFDEIEIDDWAIDKVVSNGVYNSSVDRLESTTPNYNLINPSIDDVLDNLYTLETLANDFKSQFLETTTQIEYIDPVYIVLNYLRHHKYAEGAFQLTLNIDTSSTTGFFNLVESQDPDLHAYFGALTDADTQEKMVVDKVSGRIDLGHLAYTILGYGLPSLNFLNLIPRFWTGWGGDFATLTGEITLMRGPVPDPTLNQQEYSDLLFAQIDRARLLLGANSTFNFEDICSDSDGIAIGNQVLYNYKNSVRTSLHLTLSDYYNNISTSIRMKNYLTELSLDPESTYTVTDLATKIYSTVNGLLETFGLWEKFGNGADYLDKYAVAYALAEYIINHK